MKFAHCATHMGHNYDGAKALGARSTGLTECDPGRGGTFLPGIKKCYPAPLYRVLTDQDGHLGEHSQEVPVVFKRGLIWHVAGYHVYKVADLIPHPPHAVNPGIGNDRYMTEVRYHNRFRKNRKVAHIQTHWMAVLQDKSTGLVNVDANARAHAMIHAAELLEKRIRALKFAGYQVVVSGDFNYRTYHTSEFQFWNYSPQEIFKRCNMEFHEDGLDYIGWTSGLNPNNGQVTVIRPGQGTNRADHPWLLVDLRFVKGS